MKSKGINFTPIDGGAKPNITKDAMAQLMADLPGLLQYQGVIATLQRARFLALVKEGFTEVQALELSKDVV